MTVRVDRDGDLGVSKELLPVALFDVLEWLLRFMSVGEYGGIEKKSIDKKKGLPNKTIKSKLNLSNVK